MIMNPKDLLIEMFDKLVVHKDADLIEHYYHPDFQLVTNGLTQGYESFAEGHRTVYATEISYALDYDDDAWVVTQDRVAGRIWITTSRPGEDPTEIQVMLVATVLDGRFHRLWELTWPDWSQLKAFESYDNRSARSS